MSRSLFLCVRFDVAGTKNLFADRKPQFFVGQLTFIAGPMNPLIKNGTWHRSVVARVDFVV